MFCGIIFMNNFIKIIPACAGHCTANYNLLFSLNYLFIKIPRKLLVLSFSLIYALNRQR